METKGTATASDNGSAGTTARGHDSFNAGVHETIDKVADAARPVVDRVAASAHGAVDSVADAATHAAESLSAKGEQLKDAQARVTDGLLEYMRAKPLTSLGIAVAAGFLLSKVLGSGSR